MAETAPRAAAKLRLGTRGSALALAQSGQVARRFAEAGVPAELVVIKTSGDKLLDVPLARVGGKGLFVKELEEALSSGLIDVAIHSMKDVPAELPAGFALGAVTTRADVRDVLVIAEEVRVGHAVRSDDRATGSSTSLDGLARGARVGTGSLRRRAQLASLRPDLEVVPMRGNVDTRLRKLREKQLGALVLAAAGLARLGISVPAEKLDPEIFLPAPGQGALALEIRAQDDTSRRHCQSLDDLPTRAACAAERAFLRALGASCQVPVAAYARMHGEGSLALDGLVASLDGKELLRDRVAGSVDEAEMLGQRLAQSLLARGARRVLEEAERAAGTL